MVDIMSISNLLKLNLKVPDYQRPYKWTRRNMEALLEDLSEAVTMAKANPQFKYRVGTIILHGSSHDAKYDIVDGQQRLLSLCLILLFHDSSFTCPLLGELKFKNKISQANLYYNFMTVREYFNNAPSLSEGIVQALKNTVEVVVISVPNIAEAFQLFDSQNSRGRPLDPHDLLKAYHLREMRGQPEELCRQAVTKWEAVESKAIRELFDTYLFPIRNWSSGKPSHLFSARDIDCYRGVPENSTYTYGYRARNAMPYFQITAPFPAGTHFFEMVAHYLNLLAEVKKEIATNSSFKALQDIMEKNEGKSKGFRYVTELFYCALLCYYDKFHNFDPRAVKKLFTWAMMLRVDLKRLGSDSVNKYAIGEDGRYSNHTKLFSIIADARMHSKIANLHINIPKYEDIAENTNWKDLYTALKELNEIGGTSHG